MHTHSLTLKLQVFAPEWAQIKHTGPESSEQLAEQQMRLEQERMVVLWSREANPSPVRQLDEEEKQVVSLIRDSRSDGARSPEKLCALTGARARELCFGEP